jgi:Tol biopolymer transport system component
VPGGKAVLFTVWNDTGFEGGRIALQRLDGTGRKVLVQGGGYGRIVQVDSRSAYLLYAQADSLVRGGSTRLTNGGLTFTMALTPDERRVVYSSGLPNSNLYWRSIDGTGEEERLTTSPNTQYVESVAPDGTVAAFTEIDPVRNADIWLVSLDRDRKVRPFLQTAFAETNPDFSPDGRWIAYQSNESGRFEIYITSYSEPGSRIQVTTAGRFRPRWSRDGRELYYRFNDRTMMTPITPSGAELKSGAPQLLFSGNYLGDGDFARNTGPFVMMRDNGQDTAGKTIYLLMNWFEDLKAKLGAQER